MGNAALLRLVAAFVRERGGDIVKDVDEELLELSLRRRSISLRRLDLQERCLEQLGFRLPCAIRRAWLEDVSLELDGAHVLRAKASRLTIHAEVRHRDAWLEEVEADLKLIKQQKETLLREHEAAALGRTGGPQKAESGAGGMLVPQLELDIGGLEIVLDDGVSQPHAPLALALIASRISLGQSVPLGAKLRAWTLDLQLENMRLLCSESRLVGEAVTQLASAPAFCSEGVGSKGTAPESSSCSSSVAGSEEADGGRKLTRRKARLAGTGSLEEDTVIGPCPWMQIALTFTQTANMRPSSYPELQRRRTAAPRGLGRGEEEEPLPKTRLVIRTTEGCISTSQAQLALLVAHGRMWALWFSLYRDVEPPPPEEVAQQYQRRWLERIREAVLTGTLDTFRDPSLAAFEQQHPLEQVLYQRRRALLSVVAMSEHASLEPLKTLGMCDWSLTPRWAACAQDPTHRTCFLLDVDVANTVIELRTDHESGVGDTSNSNGGIASDDTVLRFVPLCESPSSFTVRVLVHVDDHPELAPCCLQVLVEESCLELRQLGKPPATLLETAGLLYICADLQEHCDGLLCPRQPPMRAHLGALGQLKGCLEPATLFDAISLVAGAIDLVGALDPCAGLAQGCAELRARLDAAGEVLCRPPPPKPCWPAWDLRATSAEPVLLAFPAPPHGTLLLRLRPVVGPPGCWSALWPKGVRAGCDGEASPGGAGGAAFAGAEEPVLRLAVLDLAVWAEGPVEGELREGEELARCAELVAEVGPRAVVTRLAPLELRLAPVEVALLATALRSASHAGAGTGEPAPASGVPEEDSMEGTPSNPSEGAAGEPAGGAFSLHFSICAVCLALHGPRTRTPAILARADGQELLLDLQGKGRDLQVENAKYHLQRFAVSDGTGRLHLVHCSPPAMQTSEKHEGDRQAPAAVVLRLSRGLDVPKAQCEVAPLWLCAHWQTLLEAFSCVRELQAAAAAVPSGGSSRRPSRSSRLSNCSTGQGSEGLGTCAEKDSVLSEVLGSEVPEEVPAAQLPACSARLTLSKLLVFLPCAADEGLLLQLELAAACGPCLGGAPGVRASATVSRLLLGRASPPSPAPPTTFEPTSAHQDQLLLQPVRLRLQAVQSFPSAGPLHVDVRLEVAPASLYLHTSHLPLALALQSRLATLLAAAGAGGAAEEAPAQEEEPAAAPEAAAAAAGEVASPGKGAWLCQLRLLAPAAQAVLGAPPGAGELGVVVLEDVAVRVLLGSPETVANPALQRSRTDRVSETSTQEASVVRALDFQCVLWSDLSAPTHGQGSPLLEPTWLRARSLASAGGVGHTAAAIAAERLLLDATWMNVQLSADTAAVGVRLARGLADAREAAAGEVWQPAPEEEKRRPSHEGMVAREYERSNSVVPPREVKQTDVQEEECKISLSIVPPREPTDSHEEDPGTSLSVVSASVEPVDVQEEEPHARSDHLTPLPRPRPPSLGASAAESSHLAPPTPGRTPSEQGSLLARARPSGRITPLPTPQRPSLRLRNCLGQPVKVLKMETGAQPQELPDGEALELHGLLGHAGRRRPEECQGWQSRLRLLLPGCKSVDLPLLPTPQVLQAPAAPRAPSAGQVQLKEWVNEKLNTHTAAFSKRSMRRLVLARREENEAQLSSHVFLENRSAAPVAVFPADLGGVMELPPGGAPRPVPLGWCGALGKKRSDGLWCCPASMLSGLTLKGLSCPAAGLKPNRLMVSAIQSLADSGVLQPLIDRQAWQQIQQYRSMAADQYFLPARRLQAGLAGLCATACAVSARLRAEHQALFFAIVLEPAVQICNRLCCNMRLLMPGQTSLLLPGQDAGVLDPSGAADFELEAPSGALRLHQPVPLEVRQGQIRKTSLLVFRDAGGAELEAFLREEPGLLPSASWGRLQVRQYSPLSRRLTIYTSHWLLNRCGDCQVFVPGAYESGETEESQTPLRHVPRHALRMLSQHAVRRNSIQVGLCGSPVAGAGPSPLTPAVAVGRPAEGAAVVPAGPHGPQRCLGFTVRRAPWPFYRTLLVEITRRFTLVNHTRGTLWCSERFQSSNNVLMLPAGRAQALDPQGPEPQLRVSGLGPQAGYSAFFDLNINDGGQRRHFQLLHQVAEDAEGSHEGKCTLLVPEPLGGGLRRPHKGKVWCVAAVDMLLSGGAIVVRFADPRGPAFRIVNRTGRSLRIQQDCSGAPALDLPPEHTVPFAWFTPSHCHWLLVRVPSCGEQQRYEIGQVQVHEPPLSVHAGSEGKARRSWRKSSYPSGQTEHFKVRTRVRLGCREVHLQPWIRLENWTEVDLAVRCASNRSHEASVQAWGGFVCLRPGPDTTALSLQIRDSGTASSGGWSQPLRLGKRLVGSKAYLRHPRARFLEGAAEGAYHTTEVEVQRDTISDFLIVHLRPCSQQPYLLENLSSYHCTVAPLGAAGWAVPLPRRSGQVPFPSHLWADASAAPLNRGGGGGNPGRPRVPAHATISAATGLGACSVDVNFERPQVVIARPLRITVKRERPRVIVVQDAPSGRKSRATFKVTRLLTMAWKVVDVGAELVSTAPPNLGVSPTCSSPCGTLDSSARSGPSQWNQRRQLASPTRSSLHVGDPAPRKPHTSISRRITVKSFRFLSSGIFTSESEEPSFIKSGRETVPGKERVTTSASQSSPTQSASPSTRRLEMRLEGLGATMVDEVALAEVAFLCVEGVEVRASWQTKPTEVTELWAQVKAAQLDVREGEGWSSDAVLKPAQGRALGLSQPLAKLHAVVVATDGGKDWEMRHVSLVVQPLDICLDTRNVYELAEWALELAAQAASPWLGAGGTSPSSRSSSGQEDSSLRRTEGERLDPFCGEPSHMLQPRAEDFEASAPVFVRSLCLRRICCMLSVHFSGRRLGDFRNSERLQALDHVLRHCLPLDFTDAKVILGRSASSWRGGVRDVCLKDELLPDGFGGLAEGLLADCEGGFLRQVPNILFSQRLLGSPAKLGQELVAVFGLAVYAVVTCRPRALLAAMLLCSVAVLSSLEGICATLAKGACSVGTGCVPAALRREPASGREALKEIVGLSVRWHVSCLLLEWRRLGRAARISRSSLTRLWCLLFAGLRGIFAAVSMMLVPAVKLMQALRIAVQHAAWRLWPECESGWGRPLPRRACPQQFRAGAALQFSCARAQGLPFSCAAALGAVCQETPGLWSEDWRLCTLPDGEGVLVAVQHGGLFLVRAVGGRPAILWRAEVSGCQPEVVARPVNSKQSAPPYLLRFKGASGERSLGLQSWEAALTAFAYVAECWAEDVGHAGGEAEKVCSTESSPESSHAEARLLPKRTQAAFMEDDFDMAVDREEVGADTSQEDEDDEDVLYF